VELLFVVVIIGVLASIAIPAYTSYINKAKITVAIGALDSVRKVFEAFQVDYGEYPAPPVGFMTTGLDNNGRTTLPPPMVSQLREDLFSIDSYVLFGNTYTITARANDGQNTVVTLTEQGITR